MTHNVRIGLARLISLSKRLYARLPLALAQVAGSAVALVKYVPPDRSIRTKEFAFIDYTRTRYGARLALFRAVNHV